ncbi:MAG: flagellin, partial [Treponema bryantii]|nr:flagellin [Treponema bryantii]
MVINHNMSAMFANRQLGVTGLSLSKDMEKLSSGEKINRAGDDASGLAVSEKMRSQIRGLNRASQNAQNG